MCPFQAALLTVTIATWLGQALYVQHIRELRLAKGPSYTHARRHKGMRPCALCVRTCMAPASNEAQALFEMNIAATCFRRERIHGEPLCG